MRIISLLYHDVVPTGAFGASGFCSPDANIYKLTAPEFAKHLASIRNESRRPVVVFSDRAGIRDGSVVFTFDDGGVSAVEHTAGMLEELGFRGFFFITTDFIGNPGFMTAGQIRELRRRGHVIGSHSCSHPPRLSACSTETIEREWAESTKLLSEILAEPVRTASVPGGFFSDEVLRGAVKAGIDVLFNSEPVTFVSQERDCVVLGRYSIQQGTSAKTASAIARNRVLPRLLQFAFWNTKKVAKRVGGDNWLRFRKSAFAMKDRAAKAKSR